MKKKACNQIATKPGKRILLTLMVILSIMISTLSKAEAQAIANFRVLAGAQDTVKKQLPAVKVTAVSNFYKFNSKPAIVFKPIEMNKTAANTVMILNGKKVAAGAYAAEVNEIQRSLNLKGYSLSNGKTDASESITASSYLEGQVQNSPKPAGKLKTEAELAKFMDPTTTAGGITLKPLDYYSPSERKKIQGSVITDFSGADLKVALAKPIVLNGGAFGPKPLKTINETSTYAKPYGDPNVFAVGITASITRFAQIYGTDARHPSANLSEFKISADGRVYASIFGRSFDALKINGELYVPSDSSKNMTAKITATLIGIDIPILDGSYNQRKLISGTRSWTFDESVPVTIPIIPDIIDFSGLIGATGTVGFSYSGELEKTLITGGFAPFGDLKAYGEAGVTFVDIFELGVKPNLTILQGKANLSALFAIMNQNSSQILLNYKYNVSYDLQFLNGSIYVFAKYSLPWYLGGASGEYDHQVFSWRGYKESGTLADGRFLYNIYSGPTVAASTPK